MRETLEGIIDKCSNMRGDTAFCWVDLNTRERRSYNGDKPLVAASVIKLFIMGEAFRRIGEGLSADTPFKIGREMKMPSCGALSYMHDGLTVTLWDLITLMIILSDNTATNILIDHLGIDSVNAFIDSIGADGCRLNRRLFDSEASKRGIENYVTASGVARFLEMLYDGTLVSAEASEHMLRILLDQRLNGKIPFFLDCKTAHKTGEDTGITHDAGIVFSEKPFVLVMLSNNTFTPAFDRFIQDTAALLAGAKTYI